MLVPAVLFPLGCLQALQRGRVRARLWNSGLVWAKLMWKDLEWRFVSGFALGFPWGKRSELELVKANTSALELGSEKHPHRIGALLY